MLSLAEIRLPPVGLEPDGIFRLTDRPMRLSHRLLALLAAIALSTGAPAADGQQPPAQQPPAQTPPPAQDPQQPPRIRTRINYVSVDVIVSDKAGAPVLDLNQEDFAISEDGKPQKIESFSVVKIDEASQVEAKPPK